MRVKSAIRVWQRHLTVYGKLYKSSLVINFVEPVLYLAAMGVGLGVYVKEIEGVPYVRFIAPGIVASSAMFSASFECTYGTYVRMTYQKTFDAILATPVNLSDLILGEIIWGATKSLIYSAIILIVISLFGLVDSGWAVMMIPIGFLGGLVFACIAVSFAAVIPGIDYFNYFYTLFMTPMFLFSGIFFPVDTLPGGFGNIAVFTPLFHMVSIMRKLSFGDWAGALPGLGCLLLALAVLAPLPFYLMKRRLLR